MSESAPSGDAESGREARRYANARRLTLCAQSLTDERGLDGFTMDELAEAAGVSRRTLFNYFPSKDDAVLGPLPHLDSDCIQEFRAGGPTGDLIDDLAVVIEKLLRAKDVSREHIALGQRVLESNPKLMALAHKRFHMFAEEFMVGIEVREGSEFDPVRAKVAVTLLAALFAQTLDAYISDEQGRELADLYAIALRHARELLA